MSERNSVKQIGVVGWNGRGGHVSQTALRVTGGLMEPIACVEPYDDMYEKGCQSLGLTPRRYKSVKKMVEREELDGIIIGSPDAFHLENLQDLAGTGLPLLLEKPLDSTFEKICDVVRFARAYNGPIMVGHCMRYAPILQEAKKMLDRGDVGKICSVRFVHNCHYGNMGYHNWQRRRETSGTGLIDKATHDFDIMLWLLEDRPVRVASISRLQEFGGDKPADLRCRNCPERVTCPHSIQNIHYRRGHYEVEELKNADDLCALSSEVDTPDNDHCLIDFQSGVFGTYVQWVFSPRSYHHRVYEIHGTQGAMEINLGDKFGGKILMCPRYRTVQDQMEYKFDYLERNHYNGDGPMTKHFYHVVKAEAAPATTVEQAFLAELLGYAAVLSGEKGKFVSLEELMPEDLRDLCTKKLY